MDSAKLSYTVTSFAPPHIDHQFVRIKTKYGYMFAHDELQKNHVFSKNHAHLTLKRNFTLSDGSAESELLDALQGVTSKPFAVTANKVDIFATKNHGNVVVLLVELSAELEEIHTAIEKALNPFSDQISPFTGKIFIPHLSVLYNVLKEDLDHAVRQIYNELPEVSYVLSGFTLLKEVRGMKGVREVVREFRL